MQTLRELGEFVGLPQDSAEFGPPIPPIGLRLVSRLLAPVSTVQQRASMRAMINLVQTLPPISLEAQLLNPGGTEPYNPVVRLNSSPGLVISTRFHFIESGQVYPSQNFGAAGGDFSPTTLGPGQWEIVVRRAGISSSGYTRLSKSFLTSVTRPVPTPPPPPPPTRPNISVEKGGPADATRFVVTGSGFLPNQPSNSNGITVRVVDGVSLQDWVMIFTSSDSSGKIRLETNPLDTRLLARNSAGQTKISFSATDKRKDPTSVPANEPLWSNVITFTF